MNQLFLSEEKDKSVMAVPIKPKDLLIQHAMMMKEKRKKHELARRRESDLSPGDDLTFDLDDLPPLQPQHLGNQARVKVIVNSYFVHCPKRGKLRETIIIDLACFSIKRLYFLYSLTNHSLDINC